VRRQAWRNGCANGLVLACIAHSLARSLQTPGFLAPLRAADAVDAAATASCFDVGMLEEARLFRELFGSKQARACQHLFFAERATAKGVPRVKDAVARALVVGGGTMGSGTREKCEREFCSCF